jgi:hypothetical protein
MPEAMRARCARRPSPKRASWSSASPPPGPATFLATSPGISPIITKQAMQHQQLSVGLGQQRDSTARLPWTTHLREVAMVSYQTRRLLSTAIPPWRPRPTRRPRRCRHLPTLRTYTDAAMGTEMGSGVEGARQEATMLKWMRVIGLSMAAACAIACAIVCACKVWGICPPRVGPVASRQRPLHTPIAWHSQQPPIAWHSQQPLIAWHSQQTLLAWHSQQPS